MFFHFLEVQHLYFESVYSTGLNIDPAWRIFEFNMTTFSSFAHVSKLAAFPRIFLQAENNL